MKARASTSQTDSTGASLAELRQRIAVLERLAHRHSTPATAVLPPVGSAVPFDGVSADLDGLGESIGTGGRWCYADGRAISRVDAAPYFALVGTSHGAGNGSTTFNVIDMSGQAPVMLGWIVRVR